MFRYHFFILSCKSIWLLLFSFSITPKYLKCCILSNLYFLFKRREMQNVKNHYLKKNSPAPPSAT